MTSIERELGNLQARMETVEAELQGLRADLRELRDALVGVRGGWRALALACSLATSGGALIGHYAPMFAGLHN